MRFGDSRVQALAGALCVTLCAVTGITNRSLRALMTGLLGAPYGMTQASYDLARLRRNGLITRRPHANTYDLTPDGLAFAIFYTKVHDRVLTPLFAAGQPQAPPQLRTALHTIEQHIDARLAARQAACGSLRNSAQLSNPSDKGSLGDPRAADPHAAYMFDGVDVEVGSPWTSRRSARLPMAITPRSLRPKDLAGVTVADRWRRPGSGPASTSSPSSSASEVPCWDGLTGHRVVVGVRTGEDGDSGRAGGGDGAAGVRELHRRGDPQSPQYAEHRAAADGWRVTLHHGEGGTRRCPSPLGQPSVGAGRSRLTGRG